MDDTKLEELEKAYKKEKDYKIRIRMVAVRMVRVVEATSIRSPKACIGQI